MAVCRHQLGMDLEEWEAMMAGDGCCKECGAVMDEKVNLRARLTEAQERVQELETCYLGETWKRLEAEREAALRDAEVKGALARRQANGLQWAWYALVVAYQVSPPYYFYWMKLLSILVSQTAEAQEEGDGG